MCSDGEIVSNDALMENICDDTGLTVNTNKWKKKDCKKTHNKAKTKRVQRVQSVSDCLSGSTDCFLHGRIH